MLLTTYRHHEIPNPELQLLNIPTGLQNIERKEQNGPTIITHVSCLRRGKVYYLMHHDEGIVGFKANTAVKMPIVDMAHRNNDHGSNTTLLPLRCSCRHTGCHRQLSAATATLAAVTAFLLVWLCRNPHGQ